MQKLKFGDLNPDFDVPDRPELLVLCQLRSIDAVNVRKKVTPLGETITIVPNDINLYIEQQKLVSQNPSLASTIISEFVSSSSRLSDAFKGMSDDDMIETVKSRYIQSVTDMHSYADGLQKTILSMADDIGKERARRAEAASASAPAPSE